MKDGHLQGRWCCNELNAGYAADGYARVSGVGAVVVTFTVGGLSAINAVAGSYAENQAVICIVGAPNSNDLDGLRTLHHTVGKHGNISQEYDCFKTVTEEAVVIRRMEDAHELVDKAISKAIQESKPVYIAVPSNLGSRTHPSFEKPPVPYRLSVKTSNPESLEQATDAAAAFLNKARKPVIVVGTLARSNRAMAQVMELAERSGYAIAPLAAAKGQVPEDYDGYAGTFWGQASTPYTAELVQSADAYIIIGAVLSDYATEGYALNLSPSKTVLVNPSGVTIAGGQGGNQYGCVRMDDFVATLAAKVNHNDTSRQIYKKMFLPRPQLPETDPDAPLENRVLYKHVQRALDSNTVLVGETGDAIFNCQQLTLPRGATYEWMQQYGSIGWSVGATLGAAVAAKEKGRRVVACIGDGSFQVTAQDVSTMIRYGTNPIIFLVNNDGYTIERAIHEGPADNNYNDIQPWDYVAFAKAVHNGAGKLFATRATTEAELAEAVDRALGEDSDKLCFIECVLGRLDCSPQLMEWGNKVSINNVRPPREE